MQDVCLIFGAGAIGRSVAGYAFAAAKLRPMFVDVSAAIVEDLNNRQAYRIYEGPNTYSTVRAVHGIDIRDRDAVIRLAAEVPYICTCTGERGIETVFSILSEALEIRDKHAPLCVLLLENIENILERVKHRFARTDLDGRMVSFVPASIERMSRLYIHSGNEFDVMSEAFYPIIFDRNSAKGDELLNTNPELFMPVGNLEAYYVRKISTNNLGHAVLGYMGYQKGYISVAKATTDPEIHAVLNKALQEAGGMLQQKYSFSKAEMDAHTDQLVRVRFANGYLNDPIERVARDPIRKLSRSERLIGTALSCLDFGIYPDAILRAVLYALRYDAAMDQEAVQMNFLFRQKRYSKILTDICGLSPAEPLYRDLFGRLSVTEFY